MSFRECIEKHTHREYLMWLSWLQEEDNRSSLSDHYLMQIALEVRQVLRSKNLKLGDFKLEFKDPSSQDSSRSDFSTEEAARRAKSKWKAVTGITGKKTSGE